ncbi:MAG: hypothetical protein ACFKPT_12895 [Gloeotrichia echinulata GP01]
MIKPRHNQTCNPVPSKESPAIEATFIEIKKTIKPEVNLCRKTQNFT